MTQQYDLPGLYQFLFNTPEGGLRKMLVDGKPMTDVHFQLLMKVVKACKEEEFVKHIENQTWPKIKISPAEMKIKEHFWKDCFITFSARGILNPAQPKKEAA
ncbi:MAG: hypothetical protein NZ480_01560 [Bdellovibrionaceae bacterium]|nr:hypothetical protein [Pseudobdellovibrionaceae bacterium]MDW8190913.1 hypothetical protein [Pseudobdellovibrionaceae bacterium]